MTVPCSAPSANTRRIVRRGHRPRAQIRRRFRGLGPLCGTGVTSAMLVTCIPAACRERIAASRPLPGPFTNTEIPSHAHVHCLPRRVLRCYLSGIRSAFPSAAESAAPSARPADNVAFGIGDRNDRIVESRLNVRLPLRDYALLSTSSTSFRQITPPVPTESTSWLAFSVYRLRVCDLDASVRSCAFADRAPANSAGGGYPDSTRFRVAGLCSLKLRAAARPRTLTPRSIRSRIRLNSASVRSRTRTLGSTLAVTRIFMLVVRPYSEDVRQRHVYTLVSGYVDS